MVPFEIRLLGAATPARDDSLWNVTLIIISVKTVFIKWGDCLSACEISKPIRYRINSVDGNKNGIFFWNFVILCVCVCVSNVC